MRTFLTTTAAVVAIATLTLCGAVHAQGYNPELNRQRLDEIDMWRQQREMQEQMQRLQNELHQQEEMQEQLRQQKEEMQVQLRANLRSRANRARRPGHSIHRAAPRLARERQIAMWSSVTRSCSPQGRRCSQP
jgi:TolA-binding protein